MENPKEGPAPWLEKDAIYTALNKMKDGKAAGVSGIVAEMLKASGEAGLELFIELFNNIVKEEKVPSDWEMSVIINCFKGKGERGNFRGLKLLDHLMKVFERVIGKYIREAVNINDMQFGFMPGKGTMDAIFITRIMHERFLAKKKDLYFTFDDLEKAFDRVPRQVVTWALRKVGLEEWIIRVVKASATLVQKGSISKTFEFELFIPKRRESCKYYYAPSLIRRFYENLSLIAIQ